MSNQLLIINCLKSTSEIFHEKNLFSYLNHSIVIHACEKQ